MLTVDDVKKVFHPYEGIWDRWKSSPDCFLDRKCVIVLEDYLNFGSLESSCKRFRIESKEAERILNTAVILLHYQYPQFEQWLLKGFYKHSVFWLINIPLVELPIPIHYKKLLESLPESNLKEVFKNYSLKDLSQKWGVKKAMEFYELMEYYQCSHLIEKRKSRKK